jgi:tetratricopeptide (TPR) repeat protein
MYEEGAEGFPRNIGKAMECYRRVWEERGYHNGARALIDLYCKCDDPAYRDPKKAIELGLDIVEKNPKNTLCIRTLAMAYAYDGQFGKAIKYQEQALRMENPFRPKTLPPDKTLELYRQGRVD